MKIAILAAVKPVMGSISYYNFGTIETGRKKPLNILKAYARKYHDSITAENLEPGQILYAAMDPETGKTIEGIKLQLNPFGSACMFTFFQPETLPERKVFNPVTA